MANKSPFWCPKVIFGPFRWRSPFLSLVGPVKQIRYCNSSERGAMVKWLEGLGYGVAGLWIPEILGRNSAPFPEPKSMYFSQF